LYLAMYVQAMGVLLTVTVFLEGFASVRSHRDIDEARKQGEQLIELLARPASDSPAEGREAPLAERLFSGIGRARRTDQHARGLAAAAFLVSILLFVLVCLHLFKEGGRPGFGLPDPRMVAAVVLVVAQGAVTCLTRIEGRASDQQASQAEKAVASSLLIAGEQQLRPLVKPPSRAIVRRWNQTLSVYLQDKYAPGIEQSDVPQAQSVNGVRDLKRWAHSLRGRAALLEALSLEPGFIGLSGSEHGEQNGAEDVVTRFDRALELLRTARIDLIAVCKDELDLDPLADVDTHYAKATALAGSRLDPTWEGTEAETVKSLSSAVEVQDRHGLHPARWFVPTDSNLWRGVIEEVSSSDYKAVLLLPALIELLAAIATESEIAQELVIPVAEAEQAVDNLSRTYAGSRREASFYVTKDVLKRALADGLRLATVWKSDITTVELPASLMLDVAIELDLKFELRYYLNSWISEMFAIDPAEASMRLFELPSDTNVGDAVRAMLGHPHGDIWKLWWQTLEQRAPGRLTEIARSLYGEALRNQDKRFPVPVLVWAMEVLRKAQDEVYADLIKAKIAELGPFPY
jgi:hypothetical protein